MGETKLVFGFGLLFGFLGVWGWGAEGETIKKKTGGELGIRKEHQMGERESRKRKSGGRNADG